MCTSTRRRRSSGPAHGQLRELADRKLPKIDELIGRAEAVRAWLETAMTCDCDTFDACVLFSDPPGQLDGLASTSPLLDRRFSGSGPPR